MACSFMETHSEAIRDERGCSLLTTEVRIPQSGDYSGWDVAPEVPEALCATGLTNPRLFTPWLFAAVAR